MVRGEDADPRLAQLTEVFLVEPARLVVAVVTWVLAELGFGHCTLKIAVPEGFQYDGPKSLSGSRIATSPKIPPWLEPINVQVESYNHMLMSHRPNALLPLNVRMFLSFDNPEGIVKTTPSTGGTSGEHVASTSSSAATASPSSSTTICKRSPSIREKLTRTTPDPSG